MNLADLQRTMWNTKPYLLQSINSHDIKTISLIRLLAPTNQSGNIWKTTLGYMPPEGGAKQVASEMFSFLVFGMETCFDFMFSHLCFVSWTSNIIQDYRRQGTPFVMSSAIGPKCCRVTTYKYLASQWKPHVTLTHVIARYNRRIVWQNMTWGSTTLNWLPA